MKKKVLNKVLSVSLSLAVAASTLASLAVVAYAEDEVTLPEPKAVYDFSYNFEELAEMNDGFEVVENAAAPKLVNDEEMGQVLQLGKAVIEEGDQVFVKVNNAATGYIESDTSEYSTINIANPYKGMGIDLYEYECYEDVPITVNRKYEQPDWKKGITISYWIKTPADETGLGLNSNVVGFTSNRYQMQADDYAKHMTTVKYDIDANKYTDEVKELLGITLQQVDPNSDFYFELASDELYLGEPIYKDPSNERMGRIYWMNPNFKGSKGYTMMNDGSIKTTYAADRYDWWNVAPILDDENQTHDPNGSKIRYTWTYSEMWLDASSSFYFENDTENVNQQLNPNHGSSYQQKVGVMHCDSFNINSWRGKQTSLEDAYATGNLSDSPVAYPDEWHNVICVIQNDWVEYYLDGVLISTEDAYSSFGQAGLAECIGSWKPWKRFNKGAGSRYGYGNNKTTTYWCWYGNYIAPTMMEWIVKDCVNATIGGGNVAGDGYLMYANTDEIQLKNVVFYADLITEEQAKYIYENPDIYSKPQGTPGDVNLDEKINAQDALDVLKHAASIAVLEGQPLKNADVNEDGNINAQDALEILKLAAGIITEFTPVNK